MTDAERFLEQMDYDNERPLLGFINGALLGIVFWALILIGVWVLWVIS